MMIFKKNKDKDKDVVLIVYNEEPDCVEYAVTVVMTNGDSESFAVDSKSLLDQMLLTWNEEGYVHVPGLYIPMSNVTKITYKEIKSV